MYLDSSCNRIPTSQEHDQGALTLCQCSTTFHQKGDLWQCHSLTLLPQLLFTITDRSEVTSCSTNNVCSQKNVLFDLTAAFSENEIAFAREAITCTQTKLTGFFFFPMNHQFMPIIQKYLKAFIKCWLAVKLVLVFHASWVFFPQEELTQWCYRNLLICITLHNTT